MTSRPFLVVLVLALLVRVALVAATDYCPAADSLDYQRVASSIVSGHGYPPTLIAQPGTPSAYRPPAYPFALAAAYGVSGSSDDAGRVLGAVLGALSVLALMLIAFWLRGRDAALATGVLAAVDPAMVETAASALLSEALFVPLMLLMVVAALAYRRSGGRLRWATLAGLLCGLAALTRGNGVLLVVPAVVAVIGARSGTPRSRRLAAVALVAVFALTLTPWAVRNFHALGGFVPTTTEAGPTAASVYNTNELPAVTGEAPRRPDFLDLYHRAGINERQLDEGTRASALHFLIQHPISLPRAMAIMSLRTAGLHRPADLAARQDAEQGQSPARRTLALGSFWLLAAIALAGAIPRLRKRAPRLEAPRWLWLVPALLMLSSVALVGSPRYRAALEPFVVLLAAVALVDGRRALRARRS